MGMDGVLVLDTSATWKVDTLFDIFDEVQARKICSIPLSKAGHSDVVNWRPDGSGIYFVKSGYRLLCNDMNSSSGIAHPSHVSLLSRFYNEMWVVRVPSMIPIIMWRIINNFVPTYANLQSQRICFIDNMFISLSHLQRRNGMIRPTVLCSRWSAPALNIVKYAFMAEELACLQAMIFAIELDFRRVVFEGDSLAVIRRVSASSYDYSVISPIVNDIREAVKGLKSVVFNFVHREGNNAAHALAREGRGFRLPRFWIEEAPCGVTSATALDWEKLNAG
ncbi:hypothetical protein V6N11_077653 [Hibiscus sabdariffa]|uniref:RNase H type-1 domain-containing protein n=1 Tax=Hibiscus sabdariffa TaxID=183260 RepID=A0ABR2TEL4_9ROSI